MKVFMVQWINTGGLKQKHKKQIIRKRKNCIIT